MSKEALLRKIKEKAKRDEKNRCDPRFLDVLGFLVAKGGFLRTNLEVPQLPNKRIRIEDAVWAGKNVETRILEVLPAAILRLEKHFDLDPKKHKKLARIVKQIENRQTEGEAGEAIAQGSDFLRWIVFHSKCVNRYRMRPSGAHG